ncbi:MAG: hypothetical protein M1833_005193 [Piccolia ochrophora]|nr:MAG: hypothetical protein M1833_005193 [Piccolia ochrophora]
MIEGGILRQSSANETPLDGTWEGLVATLSTVGIEPSVVPKVLSKINPEFRDSKESTALHKAADWGFAAEDISSRLLEATPQDFCFPNGDYQLHIVARYDLADLTRDLLSRNDEIDIRDKSGNSPLSVAAENGSEKVISILLSHRAEINVETLTGHTQLDLARDWTIRKILLQHGAKVGSHWLRDQASHKEDIQNSSPQSWMMDSPMHLENFEEWQEKSDDGSVENREE